MNYAELIDRLRVYANDGTDELRNEAADAIERLADENTRLVTTANELSKMYDKLVDEMPDGWIPVTERLPDKLKYVLVRYKNNDMAVACWFGGDEDILFWRAMTDEGWCADCDTDPTHWMPLPEPPKEETE